VSVLVNTSTSCRLFALSSIDCKCLRGYSSKLLHCLFDFVRGIGPAYFRSTACTVADNSGRPGPRSSERAVICSFHEPEQLGSEGGASSSQLQLSGTHCRFTFAPRPSVAVSFEQGSRLIFSDWPFTDFSEENYWRDWTELNWTKLDWERPEHRVARVLHRVKRTRRKRCCRHQASAVVSPTSAECRRTLTAAWHRCSAQRTMEVASRRDVEDSGNNLSEQQNRLIMTSLWWRDITNQFEELPSTKRHPDRIYRSHQSMELLPALHE